MSDALPADLLLEVLGPGVWSDAQHPLVLAIGMQVCAGELTHAEARLLLRQALAEIEKQERDWESAFVN